jgi:hypothetical protein
MKLKGSCHCGAVRFQLNSQTPYPYMRCYCSICRKTQGGGGYAINIMGIADTLSVKGKKFIQTYRANMDGRKSEARRHFCGRCGSALWISDPRWAENVYPFASAMDTALPTPPENLHIMLDSAAPWIKIPKGKGEVQFREFPEEAIIEWHRRHRLLKKP